MHVVTRVSTILAVIVALAVTAVPVASAGPSEAKAGLRGIVTDNKDPDKLGAVRVPKQGAIVYNGHAGLGANIKGRRS